MKKTDIHPILNAIPTDRKITRKDLVGITGLTDRAIRDLVSQAKKDTVILFGSNEPGYRRAKPIDKCTQEELEQELNEIEHCINYIRAMEKKYNHQLRTYIAYKKVAEKKFTIASEPINKNLLI